jgi:adenosine deaminase
VSGRDLRSLPKAELHLHLVGAMRPSTMVELSTAAGLSAPDPRTFASFGEFQMIYGAAKACLTGAGRLRRLITEVVEDAAADGVVWTQPHFDPYSYPGIGSAEQVLDLALTAGYEAGSRHGVGFGLTLAAMRHHGPDRAAELAGFAARHAGQGVYAFGLAGDEAVFATEPYADAFAIARDAGLTAAPQDGELAGPASVRAGIHQLGATRIAHGIRAVEDPGTVELLRDREVSLDVCLTSNRALGVVPTLSGHPLSTLLEAGVACTLGADDPLLFGTGLLGEYEIARTALGLTDEQLAAIARTSITTSDASAHLITDAVQRLDTWLTVLPTQAKSES